MCRFGLEFIFMDRFLNLSVENGTPQRDEDALGKPEDAANAAYYLCSPIRPPPSQWATFAWTATLLYGGDAHYTIALGVDLATALVDHEHVSFLVGSNMHGRRTDSQVGNPLAG